MMQFEYFYEAMERARKFLGHDFNDYEILIRFNGEIANCHLETSLEDGKRYLVFVLGANIDYSRYPIKFVLNSYENFVGLKQAIYNSVAVTEINKSPLTNPICCVYKDHVICDPTLFNVSIKHFNKVGEPEIDIEYAPNDDSVNAKLEEI